MDRARASSLESHKNLYDRLDTLPPNFNPCKMGKRSRLRSLVGSQPEYSDESAHMEYYNKRDYERPMVSNSELKSQFDILQCTVNRMLNGGVFDEMGSKVPSVNLSEALKHEYRQMMNALKELENILGCKRRKEEPTNISTPPVNTDTESIHQLQREIYFRDSLIKCLSDRLKVLCKANDKLIIDYEHQENILSEELICLKRQLEKAKDAMRALSSMKSRSNISVIQDIESETYYLRESLRTKEIMISDLKHRLDKMSCENSQLKCELDNKSLHASRFSATQIDRELVYSNRINEQLQTEIDSLKIKLDCKNQLINDLQNKSNLSDMCVTDNCLVERLRHELCIANEENEITKEAILEQSDMLEDFKNQIRILSENSEFKDEQIHELRCCLRKLTECASTSIPSRDCVSQNKETDERGSQSIATKDNSVTALYNTVKRHISQNHPSLTKLIDKDLDAFDSLEKFIVRISSMVNQTNGSHSDIELFKEYLTNEINLKNSIIKYLTTNLTGEIESLEKLQSQMNTVLTFDMDRVFKNELKNYLHQCFLLDDSLKSVLEYLVKFVNSHPRKSNPTSSDNVVHGDKFAIYTPFDKMSLDTNSRMTSTIQESTVNKASQINNQTDKILKLEDELRVLSSTVIKDKTRFTSELNQKNEQIKSLNDKLAECQQKSKSCKSEIERLKADKEELSTRNQQNDRNLNLKTAELDNLEVSMRRVSDQFVNLSSAHENVKKSIEAIKDSEIERSNKEIQKLNQEIDRLRGEICPLKVMKSDYSEMKQTNTEQVQKILALSKNIESLESQNYELKLMISNLQRELDQSIKDKNHLLDSINQIQEDKNQEIKELEKRLSREPKQLKSSQTDPNHELAEAIEKLKEENRDLLQKLKEQESQAQRHQGSANSLKLENKAIELKNNSLHSDRNALENQVKQLRDKINEMNRSCEENHVNKFLLTSENEESEMCKQKLVDLETVLACLTDELNEKVQTVENLRIQMQTDCPVDNRVIQCEENTTPVDLSHQLLLQKDSEIAFLKSKIKTNELERSSQLSQMRRSACEPPMQGAIEIPNFMSTIGELECRIDQLHQQLNERSENVACLQRLLKEKDEIIENAYKIIKAKSESLGEAERMMHVVSLENTNIKDELSGKFEEESQLKLLQSTIKNLTAEITKLRSDNDKSKTEIMRLNSEIQKLGAQKLFTHSPQDQSTNVPDSSVQQINNEIQKLYVDFEGKSNEIKEYSLKEIKNRDKKIDEMNLELKMKSDQFATITVENRRLIDKIEDESQRSSKYEQTLHLKEQLLQKLMKEKDKIRGTFITELRSKNEELHDKSKTVYFLNAELHRLASEMEILNSELHVVKTSEKFQVQAKHTLEINQANLESLKTENNSLKLCINLQLAETEAMKSELTIKQISNRKLSNEVEFLNSKLNEHLVDLNDRNTDYETEKRESLKTEAALHREIENLRHQLSEIEEKYRNLVHTKSDLEMALCELEQNNLSLKQVNEHLENEKNDYEAEIDELKSKIDILTSNLINSKDKIVRKSVKMEKNEEENRRLSDVVLKNEKSIVNQTKSLSQALRQIEELTEENKKYKADMEKITNEFSQLEKEYKKATEAVKDKDRDLQRFKDQHNQLDNGFKLKVDDCYELKNEYDGLVRQCQQYQERIACFENMEEDAHRMIEQKNSQCCYLQENLDHIKKQLYMTEDKFKICNNQWLEKYGQLKNHFEQMEYDYLQLQNQLDVAIQERDMLETTINSHNNKLLSLNETYLKVNEENGQLMHESCMKSSDLERLCCENKSLQNCNADLKNQNEALNSEVLALHSEICELSVHLHESQTKMTDMTFKLKENISSIRHYGSHPSLNQIGLGHSGTFNYEQRDYCDLKNRYTALCDQVDKLVSQMNKKDKRLADLQKENDQLSHNLKNYDQIQCDFQELDYKYQQLKDDFDNLSNYYKNINFSHNQADMSVIQVVTDELQETVTCQIQQIENLKSSHQMLENDYQICCNRLKQLEEQVQIDNLELEKWNQTYCSSENKSRQLENKYDELKYAYDEAISQNHQIHELKQDVTDKTNRFMEISNTNKNIEQQIMQAHQQINSQNQIIDDYKIKLNNLETYYEKEVDQCRRDIAILKNNDSQFLSNNMDDKINCLKEKIDLLECEVEELRNQYHSQYMSCNELKLERDSFIVKTEQQRQDLNEKCVNIEKLSGQIFDRNDLIEQLTIENHDLRADVEISHQKICHLTEQNKCLNECLADKTKELDLVKENLDAIEDNLILKERESIDLTNQAEYLSEQVEKGNSIVEEFKKELASSYDTIDCLKRDQVQLCEELNCANQLIEEKDKCIDSKNKLLDEYSKEMEMSYERIQKLQFEKSGVSMEQFCQLKEMNEKLVNELDYLRNKYDIRGNSAETQTSQEQRNADENKVDYLTSPSPVSDYGALNEPEKWFKKDSDNEKSGASDKTYSTTKSVAWKSTHTDEPENVGSEVFELQKAIEEYNTLVTSIELSEGHLNPSLGSSQKITNPSQVRTGMSIETRSLDQKIDIDIPNPDEIDCVVVDVDSMFDQSRNLDINFPMQVQNVVSAEMAQKISKVDDLTRSNQPEFKYVIDLLKNCNVPIEYDPSTETFEAYFCRMMQKYYELEQFYLASMKINLDHPLDADNLQTMEIFSELFEKSQLKLIQHCQLLNSTIRFNSLELNEDMQVNNEQNLSSEDVLKLIDLVSMQQLQLSALNLTHSNLQKIDPITDLKVRSTNGHYLATEYQKIWMTENVCNPNIKEEALKVYQRSLEKQRLISVQNKNISLALNSQVLVNENIKIKPERTSIFDRATSNVESRPSFVGPVQKLSQAEENVQNIGNLSKSELGNQTLENARNRMKSLNSENILLTNVRNDSKSINFGKVSELNYSPDSVKLQIPLEFEAQASSTVVNDSDKNKGTGPNFQQQHYEGVNLSEGKTQAIKNLEDSISYASLGQFEKAMHQLNNIDYENFDSSIDLQDRIRIYAAEIDYLNEKNLFHNFAINTFTKPSLFPKNSAFVDQMNDSLTSKAKFINNLQTEYKFDPHLSKKEKDLINQVLDPKNDFTYRSLFETWRSDLGLMSRPNELIKQITELTKKLELCEIADPKTKANAKESGTLDAQLQQSKAQIDKLTTENERLKQVMKSASDKVQVKISPTESTTFQIQEFPSQNDKAPQETIVKYNAGKSQEKLIGNLLAKENETLVKTNSEKTNVKQSTTDSPNSQLLDCKSIVEKLTKENENLKSLLKSCNEKVQRQTSFADESTLHEYKSQVDKLMIENENLKELVKTSSDKVQTMTQQYNEKMKASKIPFLRGSSIEGLPSGAKSDIKSVKWEEVNKRALADMTNISKSIANTSEMLTPFKDSNHNTTEITKTSKEITRISERMSQVIEEINSSGRNQTMKDTGGKQDRSLLQSAGKLVSPEEVKAAIAAEKSIESLRQFANLLAEDNFDLAGEIEKLLVTIEELRRQLKENCDILSETVDMLQNSENFVNQLERKLNIETKKTQVITSRIDKLNELNSRVIVELERMLKQPISISTENMSSQERYDYLFSCLKKIEGENINLHNKKEELEKELKLYKSNKAFEFIGSSVNGPIDFEFETSLMPSGAIEGTINMLNNEDISKKLALTFDVKLNKDDLLAEASRHSSTITKFLIEQDAATLDVKNSGLSSQTKLRKDDKSKNNHNRNNNSCYRDMMFSVSTSLVDVYSLCDSFDDIPRLCTTSSVNKIPTNDSYRNSQINKPTSKSSSLSQLKTKEKFYIQMLPCRNSLERICDDERNKRIAMPQLVSSSALPDRYQSMSNPLIYQKWYSMTSVFSDCQKKGKFINYRKPIYFRSIYDLL